VLHQETTRRVTHQSGSDRVCSSSLEVNLCLITVKLKSCHNWGKDTTRKGYSNCGLSLLPPQCMLGIRVVPAKAHIEARVVAMAKFVRP
jgi:hypothetical protein